MRAQHDSLQLLTKEIARIRKPHEEIDSTFIRWYATTRFASQEQPLVACDGGHDGGIDAIVRPAGDRKRIVFIQGHYNIAAKARALSIPKLQGFLELPFVFANSKPDEFREWLSHVQADWRPTYLKAYQDIRTKKAVPVWIYLTNTRGSIKAARLARKVEDHLGCSVQVVARDELLRIFALYIEGASTPEEPLKFRFKGTPFSHRVGGHSVSMYAARLQDLIDYVKDDEPHYRLFSRNVRLVVRNSSINEAIVATARDQPHEFLLSHNGITLVCSHATTESSSHVVASDPSVVNGAQTLMSLARGDTQTSALVAVRVIEIGDYGREANLVRNIVLRSNSQNAISPADLVACDVNQVNIERYFMDHNRVYLRRRGQEALTMAGVRASQRVKSEKLATILASCERSMSIVVAGKSRAALFGEEYYPRLFVDQDPELIYIKLLLYELLEHGRKNCRSEKIKKRSRYAWRNVLRAAWLALSADAKTVKRLRKLPNSLGSGERESQIEVIRVAAEMYRWSWNQYIAARKGDRELSPDHYFFGRDETAEEVVAGLQMKYGKRFAGAVRKLVE